MRIVIGESADGFWYVIGGSEYGTLFAALADKAQRDLYNRTEGAFCELTDIFGDHHTEHGILVDRVRSQVGRAVGHPHDVKVTVQDSSVVLQGPVLANEVDYLLSAVQSVPGVKHVVNKLDLHDEAGNLSSLQGGSCARP